MDETTAALMRAAGRHLGLTVEEVQPIAEAIMEISPIAGETAAYAEAIQYLSNGGLDRELERFTEMTHDPTCSQRYLPDNIARIEAIQAQMRETQDGDEGGTPRTPPGEQP